ncbi:PIN domain-containing protein [candidate division KSB1 bacterium]|nr:PIN domain-containing protein [candidate division KSB1 bacterium]
MDEQLKYLLDTNIWFERLLEQERSEEVKILLDRLQSDLIYISDFSLHSIGVIMSKLEKQKGFITFITDLFVNGNIKQLALEPIELENVIEKLSEFNLDFDDAYQYSVSL